MVLKQGLWPPLLAALGRGTRMAVPTLSSQCGSGHQIEWLYSMDTKRLPIFLGISRDMSLGIHIHVGPHSTFPASGTYLLILVIAGLRVGLCRWGRWWGVRGWIVSAIAPIVVGRWWRRRRWWGCVALAVPSLVVGRWLAETRLKVEGKRKPGLCETASSAGMEEGPL